MAETAGGDYPTPSRDEILRSINLLFDPTDVIELRAIGADRTEFGYFDADHREQFVAAALAANRQRCNIYFPINPILDDLIARSANRMRRAGRRDAATGDTGIRRRRWLPIDIDPKRPSGISSTDTEKASALRVARSLVSALRAAGWPDPVVGDSGNGVHVLYRIDLPVTDASRDLVRSVLGALAARFDAGGAKVDQTVFNASRIWKTYGTIACKGDPVPNRPHRLSTILHAPEQVGTVSEAQLRALIEKRNGASAPHGSDHGPASGSSGSGRATFKDINRLALEKLGAWVPALLPMAKPYHDGYRVAAADLDRGLEEDLSLVPSGIRDFGDEVGLTAIDTVIKFGGYSTPLDAARWLAARLGVELQEPKRQPEPPEWDEIPIEAYEQEQGTRKAKPKAEKKPDAGPMLIPALDFLAKQRPADWIVSGIIQRGSLYTCTAPTNHGKTAVMMVLCLCVAAGRRFCGIEINRSRVAILCGENPDGFRVRLRATMLAMDITDEDIAGWLYVFDHAAPLGTILDQVVGEMASIGDFGLVLIDTSVAYFGGVKEDDNVEALNHARLMRELCEASGRPAVIANAHPTKSCPDRDWCVPRGGSSFLNEVDTNLSVWSEDGTCSLHWTRKKRGPDFEPINFEFIPSEIMDCGIKVPAIHALWVDDRRATTLKRELNQHETNILVCLRDFPKGTLAQWAQHARITGPNGEPLKGTVYRVLERLAKFGLAGKNRYGWHITAKGRDDLKL